MDNGFNMVLKITDIKVGTVVGNYYWTFVRVYSGENYGTGEGFFAPRLDGVIKDLGRLIIGEDAVDINRLYDKLMWATVPSGVSGINAHAISAIEIALLDLIGKHLNVPVSTLLGGRFRSKIRTYVDTHSGETLEAMDPTLLPIVPHWMKKQKVENEEKMNASIHGRASKETFSENYTPKAYASRAKKMKDEGFTAIKFDLDVPTPYSKDYNKETGALNNREVKHIESLVAAVREAVGEDIDILFDLHWRFNVESSIRIAKSLEKYNIMWLEDPVPPFNYKILNLIADSTTTPIATGENYYRRYEFSEVVNTHIKIITPDALKAGGLMETKFIAQLASLNEMITSPHNIASPLGTIAQAHVAAAIPNFGVLEIHGHDVPIWKKLVKNMPLHDGFIEMSDKPGLGVEIDEKYASRHSIGEFNL